MHRRHSPPRPPQQAHPDEDDLLFEDFRDLAAVPGIKQRLALQACVEGCARCGQRTPPFFAGYEGGQFLALCTECGNLDPPVSIVINGQRRPVLLITAWDQSDHKWFTANPNRKYRLRPPVPGEPCLSIPGAAAPIAEARRRGLVVMVLCWWSGSEFVREPGNFFAGDEDSFTDQGLRRLAEPWTYISGPETVQ